MLINPVVARGRFISRWESVKDECPTQKYINNERIKQGRNEKVDDFVHIKNAIHCHINIYKL